MKKVEQKPIKKEKMWIDNVGYDIEHYEYNKEFYCVKCKKFIKDTQITVYYSGGLQLKMCPKCFQKKLPKQLPQPKTSKTKKKKNNKIAITDPLQKIRFSEDNQYSVFDVYVKNEWIYQKLTNGGKPYYRTLSDEIKSFLKDNKKNIKGLKPDEAVKYLEDQWKIKKGIMPKPVLDNEIKHLINLTLNKDVIWIEEVHFKSRYSVEQKIKTIWDDAVYRIIIMGHRNIDNQMKNTLTFQKEDSYGHRETYSSNQALSVYNAIKKSGFKKKEVDETKTNNSSLDSSKKRKKIFIKSNAFVVRTNLFKCFHSEHEVEEIIGIVKVIDRLGVEREKKVPCAYCPECKCFFMLISEYKRLSSFGIILCQLIDKDEYYQTGNLNSFNYSSESLLMINGYNVKANNGLTEAQRHGILKNIIENKILTPHRIVSYLDMFIAQKTHMPQYKEAVDKWKKDREFVLNYKNTEKRTVKIESIKR